MEIFGHPEFDAHQEIVFAHDQASGLRAMIAIHDLGRGPALGGCRIWDYASEAEALTDVLRLSRGMSYKSALADLPLGGGKSVILADSKRDKAPEMMRAMGRAVEGLGGRYIIAEDVGATVADMDLIAEETTHVSGLSAGVGDPAPWTGRGVFLSMKAAMMHRHGRGLEGAHVSVLGLGNVGEQVCRMLVDAGARLTVADIRGEAVDAAMAVTGAAKVAPEDAHKVEADIFAPCALGAILNAETIPEIGVDIVCGAANNQLATEEDDARVAAAGVLYCPDYLVNAGGIISVARPSTGMSDGVARAKLEAIPKTLVAVLEKAAAEGIPPGAAADALARTRLPGRS